jgi:hypothetical protein
MTGEIDRRVTDLRNAIRQVALTAFANGWDACDAARGHRPTVSDLHARQRAAEKYAADLIPEPVEVPFDV